MDNCGCHELDVTLPGIQLVYLPAKCTAKHQTLDLGVIATLRIRYRISLLSATLDVLVGRRLSNHDIQSNKGHEKWGSMKDSCSMSAMVRSCLTTHGHLFLKLQISSAGSKLSAWTQCTSCIWIIRWHLPPRIQQWILIWYWTTQFQIWRIRK